MSSAQASRVVFLSGSIMAVYVLLRAKRQPGGDSFRSLWAIGVLTLGLAVAADFVPEVAGPFALLVLVAMVARNRGAIGEVLQPAASGPGPSTAQEHKGSKGRQRP